MKDKFTYLPLVIELKGLLHPPSKQVLFNFLTFNVYGDEKAEERLIPFDIVPRILSGREWARLSQGIRQRVGAINAFLHDIYHKQEIVKAGRLPIDLISNNEAFLPQMLGVNPAGKVYTHVVGIDLVKTGPDEFYVLEDNARTPSGVAICVLPGVQ